MNKIKRSEVKQSKLTPEIKKAMMGFSFVSNGVILNFTPEIEGITEEFKPVVQVKTLTVAESLELSSGDKTEEYISELIRTHIVGWKNIYDLSTEELVEFKGDINGCDKEQFKAIPITLLRSILIFIQQYAR